MLCVKSIFFWQPQLDYLKIITSTKNGKRLLLFLNYSIWIFLFFVSYSLISSNINIFWQILTAVVIAEIVERGLKSKIFWKRPLYERKDKLPPGLVKSWYQTGSFPSGHTSKAVLFFFLIIQYGIISPLLFVTVSVPLLMFRVLVGFHYPIDMVGGIIVGVVSWFLVKDLIFPNFLIESVRLIFNTVFFIN